MKKTLLFASFLFLMISVLGFTADNSAIPATAPAVVAAAVVVPTPIQATMSRAVSPAPTNANSTTANSTPMPKFSSVPIPCDPFVCQVLGVGCCDSNGKPIGVRTNNTCKS